MYYSTLAPFYHIRSREGAKYATVLHSKIMYCTAKSRFDRFSGRRTGKKTNFDVTFSSGIINLLFDGLTYNTRVLHVKPSNKMYLFHIHAYWIGNPVIWVTMLNVESVREFHCVKAFYRITLFRELEAT